MLRQMDRSTGDITSHCIECFSGTCRTVRQVVKWERIHRLEELYIAEVLGDVHK
jgi:hypothetical protein